VKISTEDFTDELECPGCGGRNLHHREVHVFERREDESTGVRTRIYGKETCVDTSMNGNPSSRRDGLSIFFDCETCDALPVLNIFQHKGTTFLEMSIPRRKGLNPKDPKAVACYPKMP